MTVRSTNRASSVRVIAAVAAAAEGVTVIRDAAELRRKESDRIACMARNLAALGARVEEKPDGLVIRGGAALRDPEEVGREHRFEAIGRGELGDDAHLPGSRVTDEPAGEEGDGDRHREGQGAELAQALRDLILRVERLSAA